VVSVLELSLAWHVRTAILTLRIYQVSDQCHQDLTHSKSLSEPHLDWQHDCHKGVQCFGIKKYDHGFYQHRPPPKNKWGWWCWHPTAEQYTQLHDHGLKLTKTYASAAIWWAHQVYAVLKSFVTQACTDNVNFDTARSWLLQGQIQEGDKPSSCSGLMQQQDIFGQPCLFSSRWKLIHIPCKAVKECTWMSSLHKLRMLSASLISTRITKDVCKGMQGTFLINSRLWGTSTHGFINRFASICLFTGVLLQVKWSVLDTAHSKSGYNWIEHPPGASA